MFETVVDAGLIENIGDISCIETDDHTGLVAVDFLANLRKAVDYNDCHKKATKRAIVNLSSRAVNFPTNLKSLEKILTTENFVSSLPAQCLPKSLRLVAKSDVASGTGIMLGQSFASVKQQLGRGAYGCVLLLESDGHTSDRTAAVKAQSPVGSLAREFEILERLRDRLKGKIDALKKSPFPEPLSFVSLADGAILTMQAVSETGFNFIDLVNFYREYLGEPAPPEILALHYVCRMLYVLEILHWFGHVLVSLCGFTAPQEYQQQAISLACSSAL